MGSTLSQQSAVDTISQWRANPTHELIFDSGRREVSQYFEAVDRLHQSSNLKGFNDELISIAMARLKHEFGSVLRRQADNQAGPISTTESSFATDSTAYLFRYEEYVAYEPPNNDVIDYLRNIAQRMSSNGNLGECIEVYKSVRKSFLQAQLKRLRFEELSLGLNSRRYMWDELRLKMELWGQVCKICVKILFVREKKLCDQIFQGLGDNNNNNNNSAKDECFVGTVQEFAFALFNFAEAISLSNHPYERMENILGVYNSFLWVLPNANALFICELGKGVRCKCAEILSKIENEVMRMLYDFENAVLHEISIFSDDRGVVHQSTVYVMDQIAVIVKNKGLLANLIKSTPSLNFSDVIVPQEALGHTNGRNFLDLHLILIVVVLQMNLDKKCQIYQNSSLGQLFMMNNIRYVLRKIEGSNELQEMIGDSYSRKLNENLKFAMDNYQVLTCSKFLACFDDEGLYTTRCFKSKPSKNAVKRRLKNFNALYEEFRFFHSFWTIPDTELREEVRVSLHDNLVPAYVDFLEKLRNNPEMNMMLLENNVKYSDADFQALILEKLFSEREIIA